MVLLHGGGHSALSWALLAEELTQLVHCQVVAFDARGHGGTRTADETDLSLATLCRDVVHVVSAVTPGADEAGVPVILVGHSMGGAVAVEVGAQSMLPNLVGLVVIDVVEGTAMEALVAMGRFIKSRPSSFASMEEAIKWSINSGQLRRIESAKVSMPGQLVAVPAGTAVASPTNSIASALLETDEEQGDTLPPVTTDDGVTAREQTRPQQYTWRVDLQHTGIDPGIFSLFKKNIMSYELFLLGRTLLDRMV